MTLPAFAYEGVGYRGLKLDGNAELKRKYLDYKTEFVVGQLMTFPAFMSVSTDDSVADDFGDFVFFVFVKVRGARVARLSQLPKEAEILVPPPSVFRIKAVAKVGTTKSFVEGQEVKSGGRLTVTLEQESCPLTLFEPLGVAIFRCDGCWRSRRRRFAPTTCRCFRRLRRRFAGSRRGPQNFGFVESA